MFNHTAKLEIINLLFHSVLRTLDSNSSTRTYGFETFRGCVKSIFSVDVCDLAIILDAPSGPKSSGGDNACTECRKWIMECNPSVEVVRIKLTSLRLDEETVDRLLSTLKAPESALGTAREAAYRARHGPLINSDKMPNVRLSHGSGSSALPRLRTLRVPISLLPARAPSDPATSPPPAWSVPSLLSILQLIFPHANVSCAPCLLLNDWRATSVATSSSASRGFKRLADLARLKVFSERRFSEERRIHQLFLSKVLNETVQPETGAESQSTGETKRIIRLREHVVSVQGVISVASSYSHTSLPMEREFNEASLGYRDSAKTSPCFVSVEACAGSIIVRECNLRNSAGSEGKESETFLVLGSFNNQQEEFILDLFRSCSVLALLPAANISRTGLTHRVMENVQSKYCGVNNSLTPLPSGWWYDGKMYVDIDGNQSEFRPDINVFLDQYIIEKNNQILNYNELLHSTQFSYRQFTHNFTS
jgi:hypothetical protein